MKVQMKTLQQALLAAVGERIAKFGFGKRERSQSFYRIYDRGKDSFHLSFIRHETDFDVTADVAIRFNDLEELIQRDNKALSAKEKRELFSMGAELGNLAESRQRRWTVGTQDDVEEVADDIIADFQEFGLPYFQQYGNLVNALDALSGDSPESWIHSPFHVERAKAAVGLAWLLKDETKLEELIEAKTKFLTERNEIGLDSFKAFVKSLQQ